MSASNLLSVALAHYAANADAHVESLKNLTRIPSISFPGFDAQEVKRSAEYTAQLLREAGLDKVEILTLPEVHPYVFAEWNGAPGAPTVLLYAHHDVQPPMRDALWKSPVFEPTLRGDRLYARGIADDKAGVLIHVASIAAFLKTAGHLPVNVKVLIEGEEEIGSLHLGAFLKTYRDKLKADVMVLTDCSNYDTGIPSLTTSLRGLVSFDVTLTALDHPLHSGMWGGPIPDPVTALCKVLAQLTDEKGRVAIPGMWEQVVAPSATEMADYKSLGMTEAVYREQSGILPGSQLFAKDEGLLVKMWREPSLVINSIQAGLKGQTGNVVLDSAWARVGLRLVPNMKHALCTELFMKHIRSLVPWGLKLDIEPEQGANPWLTQPNHPAFAHAKRALSEGYGRDAVCIGCGGTIPFVETFTECLGEIPALLVGVEDPYTNAHSENESLHLGDFHKAVRGQIHMFHELAKGWRT
jgi:cysteinylglycine-S-conjugate dipeptidase